MRSSYRVVPRVVAVFLASSLVLVVAPSARATPAAAVGRRALRCERSVAARSAAFLARQLSDFGRCLDVATTCAASGADVCRSAARERCERAAARALRRADALAKKVAVRCGEVALDTLLAPSGLGFAALAATCPALATGHADAAVLGSCVAGATRCRGERLVATALPRAGELLRTVGVSAAIRTSLACLDDRGGNGDAPRDEGDALAVVRCTRTLARASARVADRTVANVGTCARAAAACLERSGDSGACRADARSACTAAFARVTDAEQSLRRAVAARCGSPQLDFGVAASAAGLGFDALAEECAALAVDPPANAEEVADCLVRRIACDASTLVRELTPRVDDLLALVGGALDRPYCAESIPTATPAATGTPAATATPIPTATPVGPTRTPAPGETATSTPRATPTRTALPTRTTIPTPQPTSTPFCGNAILDDGEECDGDQFDDNTCEDLCFESDPAGTLRCTARCRIDFTDCRGVDCEAP